MSSEAIYFLAIIVMETFYFWAILIEIDRAKDEIKQKIDNLLPDIWVWTRDKRRTDEQDKI